MSFDDPILKHALEEVGDLRARFLAETQDALISLSQPLFLPKGLLVQANNILIWESLDPEMVDRILRGELDATTLQLPNLAQVGRKKHYLIQPARPPLVIPGWQPDNAPTGPHQLSVAAPAVNIPPPNVEHDVLPLDDRSTCRWQTPPWQIAKWPLQNGAGIKLKQRATAAMIAFGAAAAIILFAFSGAPRSTGTIVANARPSREARELADPPHRSEARILAVTPAYHLESPAPSASKPVTAAAKLKPSLVRTASAETGAIAGNSPLVVAPVKASPAKSPRERLLPPAASAQQSSLRLRHGQLQAKRSVQIRRDALSLSPRKVAAINVPMLPDVLKPQ